MSLPPGDVSLAKRKGRVLFLDAAFDSRVRSDRWTLVADTSEDAERIVSALTTGSA